MEARDRYASALAPSDVVLVETAAETVPGSQLDLGEQSAADVANDLGKGRSCVPPSDRASGAEIGDRQLITVW